MKTTISRFVFLVGLVFFGVQAAFAATANLKFYTSETNPKTGDNVELELKVDGNSKTPYYTYSVNLEYDATKLKFESANYGEGWVGIEPEAKTDIEKGIVKRTAGYPNGATKLQTILKYNFKVLAPGKAEVKITGDAALDQENQSAALQNKSITLNISGKELTEEIAALKNQSISLNIIGADTYVATNQYPFKVEHVLLNVKETIGTTTVTVYDVNGQQVMSESRTINLKEKNSLIEFGFPPNGLVPGTYTIAAESVFPGQTESNKQVKTVVVTNEVATIPTDSDNVFANIWNYVWGGVVDNWAGIAVVLVVLVGLRFLWSKVRRYRRYDGR